MTVYTPWVRHFHPPCHRDLSSPLSSVRFGFEEGHSQWRGSGPGAAKALLRHFMGGEWGAELAGDRPAHPNQRHRRLDGRGLFALLPRAVEQLSGLRFSRSNWLSTALKTRASPNSQRTNSLHRSPRSLSRGRGPSTLALLSPFSPAVTGSWGKCRRP